MLSAYYEVLEMADRAESLDKRLRVEGVKTGRITALDLPGQIDEGERVGLLSTEEAAWLRTYDRKVMELVNVDDFAPHELGTNGKPRPRSDVPTQEQAELFV